MSVKATSLSAAFARPEPLRDSGNRPPNVNRFQVLRSRSNSAAGRVPLTPTTKRPSEDTDFPSGKNPRMDNNTVFKEFEAVEAKISKARDNLGTVKAALNKVGLEGPMSEVWGGILTALESIIDSQVSMGSAIMDGLCVKGQDSGRRAPAQTGPVVEQPKVSKTPPSAEEVRKKKFVQAVREAEKSTLLFNLDLGTVPLMNTSTISAKVTQDIAAKAALVEGRPSGRPTDDTVTVLEDAISLIKGMEFYGKTTKLYSNKNKQADPKNGKFCTIPVKLNFKDKDTKQQVESLLRNKCKVQCTTPYPLNLRKAIRTVIEEQKVKYPEQFIQVRVDAEGLSLKLSRKQDGKDGKWLNNYETIALDDSVLDLGKVSNSSDEQMEVGGQSAL